MINWEDVPVVVTVGTNKRGPKGRLVGESLGAVSPAAVLGTAPANATGSAANAAPSSATPAN